MVYRENGLSELELRAIELGKRWQECSRENVSLRERRVIAKKTKKLLESAGYSELYHWDWEDAFLEEDYEYSCFRYFRKGSALAQLMSHSMHYHNLKFILEHMHRFEMPLKSLNLDFVPRADDIIQTLAEYNHILSGVKKVFKFSQGGIYPRQNEVILEMTYRTVSSEFDECLIQAVRYALEK